MRIGFDLDDTTLDTSTEIIKEASKRLGKELDRELCSNFSISETYGIKPKIVKDIVQSVLWRDYIPPLPYAIDCLNMIWLTLNCEILFISNKHKEIYDHDIKLLKDLGLHTPFILHLVGKAKNGTPEKAKIINQEDVRLFVEDRPDTILDILANTSCNIVVMDTPWNQGIQEGYRVLKVKSWLELLLIIMKFITLGEFRK